MYRSHMTAALEVRLFSNTVSLLVLRIMRFAARSTAGWFDMFEQRH